MHIQVVKVKTKTAKMFDVLDPENRVEALHNELHYIFVICFGFHHSKNKNTREYK